MGAWGYYPKDSDFALDLNFAVDDAVNQALEKQSKKYKNEYAYAGLVMIQLQRGVFVKRKYVKFAIDAIASAIKEHQIEYKNKKEFLKSAQKVYVAMQKLMNEQKKSKEILAPCFWLARPFEMKKGSSHSGLIEMHKESK